MKTTESNGCIAEADLIRFAKDPLHESYSAAAAHIYTCTNCAARLATVLDSQGEEYFEAGDEDVNYEEFWETRHRKDMWIRLSELVNGMPETKPDLVWIPGMDSLYVPAAAASFGSRDGSSDDPPQAPRTSPGDGAAILQTAKAPSEEVELSFVSCCDDSNPYYWQAVLTLHIPSAPEELLTIIVTDNRGERIPMGDLLFLGHELQVSDGCAQITLADFRNGLQKPTVSFRFLSGDTEVGEISFLKQGELK